MPRRALAEKRPFLAAAIAAALAFFYLHAGPWPELWLIPVKGAALALLALYAYLRHSSQDARIVAIMMLVAAVAEMTLEIGQLVGSFAYFIFYCVALALFLRHRRDHLAPSQKAATVALLLGPAAILVIASGQTETDMGLTLYGLSAGAFAASAWASSFPRYRVGAGAVLVMVSAMLAASAENALQGSDLPQIFAWPLAFLGHLLITSGVVITMHKRDPQLKAVR